MRLKPATRARPKRTPAISAWVTMGLALGPANARGEALGAPSLPAAPSSQQAMIPPVTQVTAPPRLEGPAQAPGADARMIAWIQADPQFNDLLVRGMQRLGAATPQEFLGKIPACEATITEMGKVESSGRVRIFYAPRKLEELARGGAGDPAAYIDDVRSSLPADVMASGMKPKIRIDGELIEVRVGEVVHRTICVKPVATLPERAELLLHELTHLVAPDEGPGLEEIVAMPDSLTYGRRMVSSPGDELDAHIIQYRARAMLRGRNTFESPTIAAAFDDRGNLIGSRDAIRDWILNDVGYQRLRFHEEYLSNLRLAMSALEQRQRLLIQLVNVRSTEEKDHLEKGSGLARVAGDSRTRTLAEIGSNAKRIEELKKRLRI